FIMISIGIFIFLETFARLSSVQMTALFGATAINLYYYFNVPIFGQTLQTLFHVTIPPLALLPLNVILLGFTVAWIARTFRKEPLFVAQSLSPPSQVKSSRVLRTAMTMHYTKMAGSPEVTLEPGKKRVLAQAGSSILDIAEGNGLAIEAGCRMGVCGADPIAILKG